VTELIRLAPNNANPPNIVCIGGGGCADMNNLPPTPSPQWLPTCKSASNVSNVDAGIGFIALKKGWAPVGELFLWTAALEKLAVGLFCN